MSCASSQLSEKHRTFSLGHLVPKLSAQPWYLTLLIEEDHVGDAGEHDGRVGQDGHAWQGEDNADE